MRIALLVLLGAAALVTAQDMGDDMGGMGMDADMGGKKVDFEADVLPLLTERCSKCHAAEFKGRKRKWKAGLRLDGKAFILKGGKSGPAVVPGKPDQSKLWLRVSLDEEHEDVMPPDGNVLEKDELALIKGWIEGGADFGKWTGAVTPKAPVATPTRKAVPSGPDRFTVYRKLAEGLNAAPTTAVAAAVQAGARVEPVMPGSPLLRVEFLHDPDAVNDKTLKVLAPLRRHIGVLGLGHTKVTDKSIAEIVKLPKLVRLDVQKTALTDAGLTKLAKGAPPELARLNLYGTKVTDKSVTTLASLRGLKAVYLWETQATAAGVRMLTAALPGCRVVFKRDLPAPAAPRNQDGNNRRRGKKK